MGGAVEVPADVAIVQVDAVVKASTEVGRRPGAVVQRPACKRTSAGIIQA